jgi:serine/threonine protein kinase/tetratricopeptide (TPR) repeat protein
VISTTAIPSPVFPACPSGALGEPHIVRRTLDDKPMDPLTFRVAAAPSPSPLALVTTPPPVGDLDASSIWDGDDEPRSGGLPRVGDTILGFQLVGELGRGAFARVFLAHQQALSGRPVALKVTVRPTREAEKIARLQHTNIVPVYSVHDQAPVQIICMPFLGRTTIAHLIRDFRADHASRPNSARRSTTRAARTTSVDSKSRPKTDIHAGVARPPEWVEDNPPLLVGDPLAVVRVLAQLAAGLTHAHQRGVLHLDLKPANVLLADTGEPMLLDFNLSFDTTRPEREMIGGTIPYMAIEQLLDLRNRGRGVIDARTDLYSLGVMAFEMLTASVPFPASSEEMRDVDGLIAARRKGPPSVRELNPAVSPAVEAIVRKLLAPDPADRYQSAEELRIDCERHLADLPLLYARERSVRERFGKWRRRNPGVPGRLLGACLLGLVVGLGGVAHLRAEKSARAEAVERVRETRGALDAVRIDLLVPEGPADRARGTARAAELLAAYGLPDDPDWQKRPEVRRLSEAERADLAGDLGELLLLLAQARAQEADARPAAERRALAAEVAKLNRAAASCFPADQTPPLVERQAAAFAALAGEPGEVPISAEAGRQQNTRDKFLDAAALLAASRYATAEPLFKQVVAERPGHAAAQFCLAYCRQQMGEYTLALDRYDTAEVLMPNDPRPAYRRGLVRSLQKDFVKAEAELSLAIAIAPEWGEAYRNRALVRLRIGRSNTKDPKAAEVKLREAEADLTLALKHGSPALHIHLLRASVRDSLRDAPGAAADRDAAQKLTLKTEGDYLVRGWAHMHRSDPKAALEDFQKAEELNPKSISALQNQAYVLADLMKNPKAALSVVTRATELYPEFAPAAAGRAIILARLGKWDDAKREIEKAQLLSADPEITYQAACVYSLTSVNTPDDRDKALALLRQALRDGFCNVSSLKTDPDLDPLRKHVEFQRLCQAAETVFK